jgi:hypothetical protein
MTGCADGGGILGYSTHKQSDSEKMSRLAKGRNRTGHASCILYAARDRPYCTHISLNSNDRAIHRELRSIGYSHTTVRKPAVRAMVIP